MKRSKHRLAAMGAMIALAASAVSGCTSDSGVSEGNEPAESAKVLVTLEPESIGDNIELARILCIYDDAFLVVERTSGGMTAERYEDKDEDCETLVEAEG